MKFHPKCLDSKNACSINPNINAGGGSSLNTGACFDWDRSGFSSSIKRLCRARLLWLWEEANFLNVLRRWIKFSKMTFSFDTLG